LAVAALPPAPVYAPSWTGFYIGVHGGAAWQSTSNWAFLDTNPFPFDPVTVNRSQSALGAVGGIQGGYNWQFTPAWVLGVEGDFSWASLSDDRTIGPLTFRGVPQQAATGISMSANTEWLSSARAKLGFVGWWNTMFFVTGGAAWANIEYNARNQINNGFSSQFATTTTKSGWIVGGGAEWMATTNILLRAEYLYYSLNNSVTGSSACQPFVGCLEPNVFVNTWNKYNVQVARVGVSYKF
jgi:outer membrane immunogenic protein